MRTIDIQAILDRIIEHYSLKNDRALATFLDVKPNTISTWRKRNTIDWMRILEFTDLDLNYMILGEYSQNAKPPPAPAPAELDVNAEIVNLKREITRINQKLKGRDFKTISKGNFSEGLKAAEPASTYDGEGIEKKK